MARPGLGDDVLIQMLSIIVCLRDERNAENYDFLQSIYIVTYQWAVLLSNITSLILALWSLLNIQTERETHN